MNLDQKILARFDELIGLGQEVLRTAYSSTPLGTGEPFLVSPQLAGQWGTSCLNLLGKVGPGSDHYRKFDGLFARTGTQAAAAQAFGILKAAKDDYEHGMLFDTWTLITAEVFSDFLEQADHLLQHNYHGPAAVVAGAVLEDGLRKLCDRKGVAVPPNVTLAPMNDALAKAGAYSKLVHDKLMPVIRLRNHAAHGEWDQFDGNDVRGMIDEVRSFMAAHFS